MNCNLKPRNDFVIIRVVTIDTNEKGIAVPQQSQEGRKYIVEEIGPKVEGLSVGDRVLLIGEQRMDWNYIPNTKGLLITKEANILLVYKE